MKKIITAILAFFFTSLFTSVGYADNPVVQTIYTSDPAPMVYKDTIYLYTGHDEDGSTYYTMNDWRVYSSTDMVNWTDHGSPLSYKTFSWSKGDAWASQCVERDGKFYWYVCATDKTLGRPAIGVAVSDSPTGPFKDALGHSLVHSNWGDIDPTVFIDDDGQAYMYWGNPNLYYVKLNKDMISYDEKVGVVQVPLTVESFGKRENNPDRATLYEEGPWFYKRNNLYYLVYAASGIPENIAYATSKNPTGPWTYRGIIMPTQGGSFTNHPGVADFKGNSYFFYHNGALPGGGGFTRSVSIEQFKYNADGTFPTINMTKEGVAAVSSLNPYARTEAETFAWESGVETEPCSNGGMDVCDINNGDYLKIKNVDFKAGAGTFTAGISCSAAGGTVELRLDSKDGKLVGTLPVSYTGGDDQWKESTVNITDAAGVHDLYLIFKGEETGNLFKMDYWKFGKKSASHELAAVSASAGNYKIDAVAGSNTTDYKVTAIYSDGTSEDVTAKAVVKPDSKGIVKVSQGIVTGTAYGTADLSVSYGGKSGSFSVFVKDLSTEKKVKQLTVDTNAFNLRIGLKSSFLITAEYEDGHTEDVTTKAEYSNPNADIAAVNNGVIIANAVGTANVSVSFQGELGEAAKTSITVTVSALDPYDIVEAETMDDQSGVQTEDSSENGKNVGYIENGDWIMFSKIDLGSGAKTFEARVSSAGSGGSIEVHLDSLDGPLAGTVTVESTGGWQTWVTKSCEVSKDVSGVHDLYLKFTGGSGYLMNFNWWKFTKSAQDDNGDTTGNTTDNATGNSLEISPTNGPDSIQPDSKNTSDASQDNTEAAEVGSSAVHSAGIGTVIRIILPVVLIIAAAGFFLWFYKKKGKKNVK